MLPLKKFYHFEGEFCKLSKQKDSSLLSDVKSAHGWQWRILAGG